MEVVGSGGGFEDVAEEEDGIDMTLHCRTVESCQQALEVRVRETKEPTNSTLEAKFNYSMFSSLVSSGYFPVYFPSSKVKRDASN